MPLYSVIVFTDHKRDFLEFQARSETLGHSLTYCTHVGELDAEALSTQFNQVVLFDLDGYNANSLEQVAEKVAQNNTPFFLIAGPGFESDLPAQKQAKPAGYISKPLVASLVYANLALSLEQRRSTKAKEHKLEELFVKNGKEYIRISTDDILWVQASGNYIEIFTAQEKSFLLRVGLKELEERLPEQQFIRVHKSYIVNKKHILKFNSAAIRTVMGEIPLARSYFGSVLTAFTVI